MSSWLVRSMKVVVMEQTSGNGMDNHVHRRGHCGLLISRSLKVVLCNSNSPNRQSVTVTTIIYLLIQGVFCCAACTRADAAIATGAAAKPSPTFQPSSLRSPSPARGASHTPSPKPQPAKPPAAAAASKTVYYPVRGHICRCCRRRHPVHNYMPMLEESGSTRTGV